MPIPNDIDPQNADCVFWIDDGDIVCGKLITAKGREWFEKTFSIPDAEEFTVDIDWDEFIKLVPETLCVGIVDPLHEKLLKIIPTPLH